MSDNHNDRSLQDIEMQETIKLRSTDNAGIRTPHFSIDTLLAGERQAVAGQGAFMATISEYGSISVARAVGNTVIGATGAAGDILAGALVTVAVATADLVVKDGAGVAVLVIPASSAAGTYWQIPGEAVKAATSAFYIEGNANAGTITAFGLLT